MKKFINISVWTSLIIVLGILLGFSSFKHKNIVCKNYQISISYYDIDTFLRKENIEMIIHACYDSIIGKSLKDININSIEMQLEKHPFISNADVFTTVEGDIKIKVSQRKPIVRVMNKHNEGYYIDAEGYLMPLAQEASSRVLIANGNISYSYNPDVIISVKNNPEIPEVIRDIYSVSEYIENEGFFKTMIDQIYINGKKEIELIPKIGDQLILFGDAHDCDNKFEKLKALYKDGFKKTGWRQYKTINLKYKNQVVCSKK